MTHGVCIVLARAGIDPGIGIGRTFLGYLRGFCAACGCRLAEWQKPVDSTLGIRFCQRMRAMPRICFRCEINKQEVAC